MILFICGAYLIYRPYINTSIANFIDGWARHPMSSTNGLSPWQLWMQGMLRNYNSGHRVTDEIYGDQADNYVSMMYMVYILSQLHAGTQAACAW